MRRCSLIAAIVLCASLAAPVAGAAQESRTANIDVVLLVDKSLSMVDAEAAVKSYIAGEVIGPIVMPGDRLIIETFYGKIDRLYAGTIRSEDDKAAVVRSLNSVSPNGRFTDIGEALDRASLDLAELGQPERPKYVLLLTDERQEAPAGTRYYAPDYKLVHPALQYVRRVDLGLFRAITVGYDVGARIDQTMPGVMQLLTDLPPRKASDFPDLPAGTDPGLGGAASAAGGGAAGAGQAGASGKAAAGISPLVLAGGIILLLAILAVVAIRIVQSKNKHGKEAPGA
jgi:hypothetical protein